jgi:hypothetical protein
MGRGSFRAGEHATLLVDEADKGQPESRKKTSKAEFAPCDAMVPVERIELPTFGLQNRCSTAELNRRNWGRLLAGEILDRFR